MSTAGKAELLRMLPSVDELLRSDDFQLLGHEHGQRVITDATRVVLTRIRAEISASAMDPAHLQQLLSGIADAVRLEVHRSLQPSLRPVINATGVILHTNLGRAPLLAAAFERIQDVAAGYSNLEFDLETGERGRRDAHADEWFARLIRPAAGTDVSTIVVNNNAAAVLLALNTLAEGSEVIVSRGELVEIGGSFRIPDVMAKSQATLREVGTTNRTRIEDYERAINVRTRLLLRVHRSNFEIVGFTEQPTLRQLADLAAKHQIPLVDDLGSGSLEGLRSAGISSEPSVQDSLEAGVDVVTYSGDKLLGGPQCGLITGREDLIVRMRKNPLFRALRVDKMTYASLEATLLAYVNGDTEAIPALRMMRLSVSEIAQRVEAIKQAVLNAQLKIDQLDGKSVIGGGAAPSATLPTRLLALQHTNFNADELASCLRHADPPVVTRVEEGRVVLDLRTVFPEQDKSVVSILQRI